MLLRAVTCELSLVSVVATLSSKLLSEVIRGITDSGPADFGPAAAGLGTGLPGPPSLWRPGLARGGRASRRSVLALGLGLSALASPLLSLGGATPALAAPLGAQGAGGTRGALGAAGRATDSGAYISFGAVPGGFTLVKSGRAVPLVVSGADHAGVIRAVGDLQSDIERVTGVRPAVVRKAGAGQREIAIVGTIGRSPLIDALVDAGKLDVRGIAGTWETSLQTIVERPMPGVDRAFVIAGSDQRGTIFGAYDVSRGIGVSPWYWWDDVVPEHRDQIHVRPGRHTQGTPR